MSKLGQNQRSLLIILASILVMFAINRSVAYLALEKHLLPLSVFLNIKGFRLHHFVYGNILILVTSFLAIGLNTKVNRSWLALFYGLGLGLVLDEFPLWMGDIHQLNSYVVFIPYAPTAILAISVVIILLLVKRKRSNN